MHFAVLIEFVAEQWALLLLGVLTLLDAIMAVRTGSHIALWIYDGAHQADHADE